MSAPNNPTHLYFCKVLSTFRAVNRIKGFLDGMMEKGLDITYNSEGTFLCVRVASGYLQKSYMHLKKGVSEYLKSESFKEATIAADNGSKDWGKQIREDYELTKGRY